VGFRDGLPAEPAAGLIRGDAGFGNDPVRREAGTRPALSVLACAPNNKGVKRAIAGGVT